MAGFLRIYVRKYNKEKNGESAENGENAKHLLLSLSLSVALYTSFSLSHTLLLSLTTLFLRHARVFLVQDFLFLSHGPREGGASVISDRLEVWGGVGEIRERGSQ